MLLLFYTRIILFQTIANDQLKLNRRGEITTKEIILCFHLHSRLNVFLFYNIFDLAKCHIPKLVNALHRSMVGKRNKNHTTETKLP